MLNTETRDSFRDSMVVVNYVGGMQEQLSELNKDEACLLFFYIIMEWHIIILSSSCPC